MLELNKKLQQIVAQVDFSETAPRSGTLWVCVYRVYCGLIYHILASCVNTVRNNPVAGHHAKQTLKLFKFP